MSATKMIGALERFEAVLQELARVHRDYQEVYAEVARGPWPDKNQVSALDHAFGPGRVHHLLTRRMQTLGLSPIPA